MAHPVSHSGVHPEGADSAVRELIASFPSAKVVAEAVDVRDEQRVREAVAYTVSELGSINTLSCFAGVVACTHALELGLDKWKRTLDINTTGSWLCAQAAANEMVKQQTDGSIVFTASISAQCQLPTAHMKCLTMSYDVSKGALLQLKNSLAAELARYGIRTRGGKTYMGLRNLMGRMGHPAELTSAAMLLCSRTGRYINGVDVLIDGGGTVF